MRLRFWRKDDLVEAPKLTGECAHVWSNWSAPTEVMVEEFSYMMWRTSGSGATRTGWAQDRRCLLCNMYERRIA